MSPRIQSGLTRMATADTLSPKVTWPALILLAAGVIVATLDLAGIIDVEDGVWLGLLGAGGVTGVTGYAAPPGPVVQDPNAVQDPAGERGQTNVWFLLGGLTVAVVVLALVVLT